MLCSRAGEQIVPVNERGHDGWLRAPLPAPGVARMFPPLVSALRNSRSARGNTRPRWINLLKDEVYKSQKSFVKISALSPHTQS
jgi:hypothetical protein